MKCCGNNAFDTIHEGLGIWRTTGHINVNRHDTVAAAHDRVAVVIETAAMAI